MEALSERAQKLAVRTNVAIRQRENSGTQLTTEMHLAKSGFLNGICVRQARANSADSVPLHDYSSAAEDGASLDSLM